MRAFFNMDPWRGTPVKTSDKLGNKVRIKTLFGDNNKSVHAPTTKRGALKNRDGPT